MAWFVYCKACVAHFSLHNQPPQIGGAQTNVITLRCPSCGHSDQYTPGDLLRALEAAAHN